MFLVLSHSIRLQVDTSYVLFQRTSFNENSLSIGFIQLANNLKIDPFVYSSIDIS